MKMCVYCLNIFVFLSTDMTSKLRFFVVFVCGLFVSLICSANVPTQKLIVRGSDNYPPFEFINSDGIPDGFNVELFRALMKELGYDYDLRLGNWNEVIEGIHTGEVDAVIGMIYSPERAASVRFTLPTCVINRNFITRRSDDYHSFRDLEGKEIIVEKGGWFHNYLLNNNLAGKIIESDDIYESLRLLSQGKHDAVLASDLVGHYAIKELGLKNLNVGSLDIVPQNYAIAVSQNNDGLLYHLNLGLQQLKSSGAYDQIYNKWFGVYESQKNREAFFIALGIFLFIAALLVVFVWQLRRQVARATRMLNYSRQEVGIAIDAGKISAWTYLIHDRTVSALHGKPIGAHGGSIDEIYAMIHPEDVGAVHAGFDALSAGTENTAEIAFRIRDDEKDPYRYFETRMVRVEATKELPCRIVGTLKELTDEVLMQQNLEDYRIKTEFIVRINEIILIQYDIASRIFFRLNDADTRFEVTYTVDEYLAVVHPDDVSVAALFVEELNRGKEPKIETEFRFKSRDGAYEWYIITAAAYKYDSEGHITSYIGLRRNNTKWKSINSDLILLKEKADASNRLKSAFLANMSHEIRTPLNAIVGFSELVGETDDPQERKSFIEIVKKNNELLLQLISDILDLSRIEAGHINFTYDKFDFSAYFRDLGASLKIKETDSVELRCLSRYEDLMICSDRNRIAQVITNFVNNAFKFTTEGSITMDYVYENDGIRIMVTDTGIGIAPENLDRVFGRFEKVNDFAQGTGLGLSICQEIVDALQGKIGVESKPGEGSTFWIWLPCNVGIEESKIIPDIPVQEFSATLSTLDQHWGNAEITVRDRQTVLIAEDIDNNFIIISTVLKDNYNIIRAENGVEAVEKARLYNPDIILMDMKMPMMGGLEATRNIRKFNPQVPIIALTAYVFDTNKQDALNAGCNDFITKPVNRSVLMQILGNCK